MDALSSTVRISLLSIGLVYLGHQLFMRSRHLQSSKVSALNRPAGPEIELRLQRLPLDADETELLKIFTDNDAQDAIPNVATLSLAPSLDERHRVATICLRKLPNVIKEAKSAGAMQGSLPILGHEALFDDNFYDLTPLYWPTEWDVDIVAITGLAGKAIWSWKAENASHMWLRDWLGPDLLQEGCAARIFTYGYPSKLVNSTNDAILSDYAKQLLMALARARQRGRQKPLILIGHSFGGLVIKQLMKLSYYDRSDAGKDISESCICTIMLGVPNKGLENAALLKMVNGQKNYNLIQSLSADSPYLQDLDADFSFIIRDRAIHVIAVVELEDTQSVEFKKGSWARSGPMTRMVPRDSAMSRGLGPNAEEWPSHTDHSKLAKFKSQEDPIYRDLVKRFAAIAKRVENTSRLPAKLINVPEQQLSSNFVGRKDIVDSIDDFYTREPNGASAQHIFILLGSGGMGKSQIVLKYATAYAQAYEKIVWIRASSTQQLLNSFQLVAASLGIGNASDDPVKAVISSLSEARGNILLVYDGLDDDRMFEMFRNDHKPAWGSSIRVIITTRTRHFKALAGQSCHVGPLDSDNGIELLRKVADSNDETDALSRLGNELGWLPLALHQAASYIRLTGFSIAFYLRKYREHPIETLEYRDPLCPEIGNTMMFVLEQSMDHVRSSSPYAERWLTLCSYLGSRVNSSLFGAALEFYRTSLQSASVRAQDELAWMFERDESDKPTLPWDRIAILGTLHLVDEVQDDYWEWHALVATWARYRQKPIDRKRFLVIAACFLHACAQGLIRQHAQGARHDDVHAYYAQLSLVPHVDFCIRLCQQMLEQNIGEIAPVESVVSLGALCVHVGEYTTAQTLLKAALRQHDALPVSIINARRTLSWALRKSGQTHHLEEALEQQQAAIQGLKAMDSQEVHRARGELATIYRDLKMFDEAIQLQKEVVAKTKDLDEKRPSAYLNELSCLATIYHKKGNDETALTIDTDILQISEKAYPRQPEQHKWMRQTAISLYRLKHYQKAIELEEKVLEGTRDWHGENHLETATAMYYLAWSYYQSRADLPRALDLTSMALGIRRGKLGETHERTRKTAGLEREILGVLATESNWEGHASVQHRKLDTTDGRLSYTREDRVDSGLGM